MPPAPPASSLRLGVVLAAGAGSRFGGPKIHASGGQWVRGAVAALRDGGCDEVGVCMGAALVDLPPGVLPIVVPDWAEGMSATVGAALARAGELGASQLVLHLVDLPDVGADVVARLLEADGNGPAALARAAYQGRPGHPVLLGRAHWPGMAASLAGDAGGRAYLRERADLLLVECGDLAGGRDIDHRPVRTGREVEGDVPESRA